MSHVAGNVIDDLQRWTDGIINSDLNVRQRYVALWRLRKELEAIDKQLGTELDRLDMALQEDMLAEGMTNVRLNGVSLYIKHQLWATPAEGVERAAVVHALEKLDMEGFITYNTTSLSSYMRELAREASGKDNPTPEEAREALPDELKQLINVEERINIGARRS